MANQRGKKRRETKVLDRHHLYSAAVQSVDSDLAFFRRVFGRVNGRPFRLLREDFCGTALLARQWVRRRPEHRAWGVDLHSPTLRWGDDHYDAVMGDARSRLALICRDVREVDRPQVDVVCALNFSYSVFKSRADLGAYFRRVRRSLRPGGIYFLDAWGGTDSVRADKERRHIPAEKAADGTRLPAFTYIWDQERFNPIDHHILCHIHFKIRGGRRIRRAFTYDWRMWTLPELRELLADAGFRSVQVHVEGWDEDEEEGNGIFRRKTYFENDGAWIVYLIALT